MAKAKSTEEALPNVIIKKWEVQNPAEITYESAGGNRITQPGLGVTVREVLHR